MKPERIPLFPLNLVLFPGAALPLHIFEQRYKEMIARCIEESIAFGIVYAPEGGIASVGCTAEIRQVLRKHADGRLDILTRGADVIRIIRVVDEKPYFEALVQYLNEEPDTSAAKSPAREELLAVFQKCHQKAFGKPSPLAPDFPDDLLSYRLAAELPIELSKKQELLELRDESQRRAVLIKALIEWLPRQERVDRTRVKAAGNGHAPHLKISRDRRVTPPLIESSILYTAFLNFRDVSRLKGHAFPGLMTSAQATGTTATTLGQLRRNFDAHKATRSVKEEIRDNLLCALEQKKVLFTGIHGYEETVLPQIVNAILAKHNFILLGLRGQAKSRILRGLTDLLDAEIPYIAGCEIHDHPFGRYATHAANWWRKRATTLRLPGYPAISATWRNLRRLTSPSPTSSATWIPSRQRAREIHFPMN